MIPTRGLPLRDASRPRRSSRGETARRSGGDPLRAMLTASAVVGHGMDVAQVASNQGWVKEEDIVTGTMLRPPRKGAGLVRVRPPNVGPGRLATRQETTHNPA